MTRGGHRKTLPDGVPEFMRRAFATPTKPFGMFRALLLTLSDPELESVARAADAAPHGVTRALWARMVLKSRRRGGTEAHPRGDAARRRGGPAPAPRKAPGRPAAKAGWLERHGLEIGDMVDVTNCAGRTFTGRIVEVGKCLGWISLDGDPRFAFSLFDAKVRRSLAKTPSRFLSAIPERALDWRERLQDARREKP